MKRIIVLITVALFAFTGCTGSFKLTKTVNNFHRSQPEKWVDEIIFLGCAIFPIYGFAMLGDAIILNSVEFWTGRNPIASLSNPEGIRTIQDGEDKVVISHDRDKDTLNIKSTLSPDVSVTFLRSDTGVRLMDSSGNVLYTSSKDSSGGVSVFDSEMKLVKHFSPEEVLSKHL